MAVISSVEEATDPGRKPHAPAVLSELVSQIRGAKADMITLNSRQSFLLRWEAIAHLNAMEVVAHSWLVDLAHRPTIEAEMRFILDDEPGKNILTTARILADSDDYPALFALVAKLELPRKPTHQEPEQKLDGPH